jgi:hypothetical protein
VRRTSMKLAAAVLAGGLAATACSSLQLGAAATSNGGRISSAQLTNQVQNLNSAYAANTKKGIKPQRSRGQEAQQVLTWLLTFQIFDKLAQQNGINVSETQVDHQLASLQAEATQEKVSLATYVSAAGAVPPDLTQQIGRYFAILSRYENRLDGGKQPTTSTAQAALQARVAHAQCLAAKDLAINVNPQYGAFDYGTYAVVTVPSKLSSASLVSSSQAAASAKPRLTPPC